MREERKFKASHFENIQELIASCMIWIKTDDYDAYCRFFDMGAMEELIKELNNLKEIEKSHKEENGKLRVELDQEKEKNKKIEEYITDKIEIEDEIQTYISEKFVEDQYISKDKIMELLENEIIDISGFRCIAVEDIENLLEEK